MEDEIEFFVRYSETDQMSFVYHGNYVKYFEMGRIAWLNKLGFSYKKMEEDGILLPVIDLNINFRKSALFEDKLSLKTRLIRIPSYMIEFEYKITRGGNMITSGYTKLIFLNSKTHKPMRCPDQIINAVKKAL